jgi:hypothetical protein
MLRDLCSTSSAKGKDGDFNDDRYSDDDDTYLQHFRQDEQGL